MRLEAVSRDLHHRHSLAWDHVVTIANLQEMRSLEKATSESGMIQPENCWQFTTFNPAHSPTSAQLVPGRISQAIPLTGAGCGREDLTSSDGSFNSRSRDRCQINDLPLARGGTDLSRFIDRHVSPNRTPQSSRRTKSCENEGFSASELRSPFCLSGVSWMPA